MEKQYTQRPLNQFARTMIKHPGKRTSWIYVPSIAGLSLVVVTSVAFIVALLTGRTPRRYSVLPPNASVTFMDREIAVGELVNQYKPTILMRTDVQSPPARKMWWEAVDDGDTIALIYRVMWEDENHPVPVIDWLYSAYRAAYYGIEDIEYIQINVRQADGVIQRIRYEDTTADAYDAPLSNHRYITIDHDGSTYTLSATEEGKPSTKRTVHIAGPSLKFGVTTWSHQLTLIENTASPYTIPLIMPLAYLTDHDYATHKLARRSYGDYARPTSTIGDVAGRVLLIVLMGLPYVILRLHARYRKQRATFKSGQH